MRSPYPEKHTNDGMIIGDLSKCRHYTVMLEINDNMFVSHLWVDKCV